MATMNGYVTIGFKADKKQLENDIKDIERELKSYDKRREEVSKKITTAENNMGYYELELNHNIKLIEKTKELHDEYIRLNAERTKFQELGGAHNMIKVNDLTKQMDAVKSREKEINSQISREADKIERITDKYEEAKINLEDWKEELEQIDNIKAGLIDKSNQYTNQIGTMSAFESDYAKRNTKSFNNLGKSMDKIIKKVAKWGLAVFGIRSAYQAIRSAMSIISQYDEQLATDIEYIRFALAITLKPFVEWLIKMIMRLLQLVGRFIYDLTGINIFANATADAFNRTTKSVKDLKKQLAGFDEMNVLSSDASSASGIKTPSINLSKLGEPIDYEGTFEKVKNMWVKIKKIFFDGWDGIIEWVTKKLKAWKVADDIISGVEAVMKGVQNIVRGAFDVIEGTIKFFIALINVDLDGIKKAVKEMINGLITSAKGFIQMMLGQLGTFLGTIRELGKNIWKAFTTSFSDSSTSITKGFGSLSSIANGTFKKIGQFAQTAWNVIKSTFGGIANYFQNIFSNAWAKVKNVFSTGGKIFTGIKEGIESSFKIIVNKLIDGINKIVTKPFEKINETLNSIRDVNVLGLKPFKNLWSNNPISIPKIPKLATGAILNMPGKGVYHDGSIIAERGAEGILPLTDASAMRLLGQTIGEYITITANIENNMNGRLISRLIKEIQGQQDFSYNR